VFATVRPHLASPPTTGLVVSAHRPADDGVRWESGVGWVPERCGLNYQLVPLCSGSDPGAYTPDRGAAAYVRPVGVRFASECSTLGGELDSERLRRMAEATTPFVVARELWDGALSQTDPFTVGGVSLTNRRLAQTAGITVVGSGGSETLTALGRLEQAALEATRGQRIALHIPVRMAAKLGDFGRRVGNDYLTKLDNVVIADAGYPGTGPAGQAVAATAWAYATPWPVVRLSPLAVVDAPTQAVDRARNTVTVWAERVFAATFDPCAHFATEITL
jgi:hypothetical protein